MSVRKNIGYGLKVRRTPKDEARRRVDEVAKLLGLEELLERKPAQLSGGQRQRVAMGRAIVREPKAFLMDEPLSNLDAKLRVEMRASLAQLHARLGVTTVYVTHDQTEAMTLGQRVAVLDGGRDPAGRHAAAALRPPGEPLRRRLHRHAGDEPRRGRDRRRRGRLRRLPHPARRRAAAAGRPAQGGRRRSPRGVRRGRVRAARRDDLHGRPRGRRRAWLRRSRLLPRRRRGGRDRRQRPRRGGAAARVESPLQRPRRPACARPRRRAARARARPGATALLRPRERQDAAAGRGAPSPGSPRSRT